MGYRQVHTFSGVLVQSTLAILILVGFESCTSLAAETKSPEKNIPKAIIIALIVQGLFAYLLEYFAAGTMVSEKLICITGNRRYGGNRHRHGGGSRHSGAPIGDLIKLIGNSLVPGIGFGLMITMALTVAIAIIGTTLSCMNTAVRISNGMAEAREVPEFLSFMSGFSTPHTAIWALVVVSSVIAAVGVQSVVGLTGITLASNFGTFVLYGLICVWTIVAFRKRRGFPYHLSTLIIPGLGVIVNVVMLVAIIYLYAIGNADSKNEAKICFYIAGGWALLSFVYVIITSVQKTYGIKMISAMIRPEKVGILTEVLKDEDLLLGMTVTKVKGIGRRRGTVDEEPNRSTNGYPSFPRSASTSW